MISFLLHIFLNFLSSTINSNCRVKKLDSIESKHITFIQLPLIIASYNLSKLRKYIDYSTINWVTNITYISSFFHCLPEYHIEFSLVHMAFIPKSQSMYVHLYLLCLKFHFYVIWQLIKNRFFLVSCYICRYMVVPT